MTFEVDDLIQHERRTLLEHPLFTRISTVEDVRLLMENPVFAVWEFMTLLKRIQHDLTCVDLPWLPPRHTLDVALNGLTVQVLAYFFFGREDITPDMFGRLLERWAIDESNVPMLTYYLKRHIEMNGDDHRPAAKRIIAEIVDQPSAPMPLPTAAAGKGPCPWQHERGCMTC